MLEKGDLMDRQFSVVQPVRLFTVMFGLFTLLGAPASQGQTTSITSSGLNTKVTLGSVDPAGRQNYDITGGTRPGNGGNLFHSFGDFSVGTNNVARFGNDSGLATTNILSRVTGGNPSNIFGEINTANFPGANLYLINPAGVVFGSTATLNVGGSVKVSTADYLRLADGLRFNAVPGPQDALLSSSPVAAFGFLNPHPRPITVQGATLEVPGPQIISGVGPVAASEEALSLVGGDITIAGGTLKAPSGQVHLLSVASRGEVHPSTGSGAGTPGLSELRGPQTLGRITLTDSLIQTNPVPFGGGGDIVIRGGQLVMQHSAITAEAGTFANGGAITIKVGDTLRADDSRITSHSGEGVAGAVALEAGKAIRLTNSRVESTGSSLGQARTVDLTAPVIKLNGSLLSASAEQTFSDRLGSVTIQADHVQINNFSQINTTAKEAGGTVVINATDTVRIDQGGINASALVDFNSPVAGQAGNISITAGESVRFNNARLFAGTNVGNAGNIVIDAGKSFASEGGTVSARSGNGGNSGNIIVQAPERIRIDSGFVTTSAGGDGAGGNISLSSDVVRLRDHTVVQSTAVNGSGGNITINANDFRNLNSTVDVKSQFGPDGTVSIQPLP